MAASEIIQILFKLDRLDEVEKEIENAYQKYLISPQIYLKYKQYLYIKKGEKYKINKDEIRSTFIDLAYDYRETRAVSCITCLNKANQGTKYLYLNSFELEDLYYELRNNLSKYNYFMTEFYDVYIIDMGKPIGVADYQLVNPQDELKRIVADEVKAFGKELPYRTESPLLDSEHNDADN